MHEWMDKSHVVYTMEGIIFQEVINVSVIPRVHRRVDEAKEDSQSRAAGI